MEFPKEDFDKWMGLADLDLARGQVPIPDRPFKAVCLLLKWGALEIKRGDQQKPLYEQRAFAHIHQLSATWFREKYKGSVIRARETLTGVVLFSGAPFELRVPTRLNEVEEVGKTAWLIFPVEVQSSEDPMTWIVSAPNFAAMSPSQQQILKNQVVKIGTGLRSIDLDLITAKRSDSMLLGLANDIMTHLIDAAIHILAPAHTKLRLACWDSHQAAEKTLKAMCRQKTGSHEAIHELERLYKNVPSQPNVPAIQELIGKLPSAQEAIKLRANECREVGLLEAIKVYRAAVLLVRNCARTMPRDIGLRNARFLLRKAPYAV